MGKVIRVDMEKLTAKTENLPDKYRNKGGRWLTDSYISDEVDPECHPLGPRNKLVFAPGMVTGTKAPSSGRLSVGAKSPLTGGIKEANAGTPFAEQLALLGYSAIVVEGQPKDKSKYWQLEVDAKGVKLAETKIGVGDVLSKAYSELFKKYGKHVGIASIGSAGEQQLAAAGICFNDMDGRASRYAGRGGLGAVMGSKKLKYIILDDKGAKEVEIKDKSLFNKGRQKLAKAITEHGVTKKGGTLNAYGTAALINVLNEAGGLPTRNFREGRFEGAEKVSGEAIKKVCEERGGVGTTGHQCHASCLIKCSNVYPHEDGTEHVSCIEYESGWAFGPNCGIDNLDHIAELVRLSNEYGVDTIEMGGTIAVAMDGGLAKFGDGLLQFALA